MDGHPDPQRASPAQQSLDLSIARLIKKYHNEDPPAEPKLAIPISTITAVATNYRWNTHLDAAADLVIIAFFYLLRVEEYTTSAKKKPKCTIALRDQDVRLWRKGQLIPHSAGLDLLLTADSATICIAHTKNGTKEAVVHHKAFRGPICPVAALAWRIANMQGRPALGSLSSIYHASGQVTRVSDRDIGIAIRWGATSDRLLTRGYTLQCISSHSLRAGGAMAMKLSGASDSTIMRVGQWTRI